MVKQQQQQQQIIANSQRANEVYGIRKQITNKIGKERQLVSQIW